MQEKYCGQQTSSLQEPRGLSTLGSMHGICDGVTKDAASRETPHEDGEAHLMWIRRWRGLKGKVQDECLVG